MTSEATASARGAVAARLEEPVHRKRHRARLAGDAAGDDHGRAELAERAGEAEQRAGQHAASRERQADSEEHAERPGAQRLGHLLEASRALLETGARSADDERQAHHDHRDDERLPGEDDVDADPIEDAPSRPRRPSRRSSR